MIRKSILAAIACAAAVPAMANEVRFQTGLVYGEIRATGMPTVTLRGLQTGAEGHYRSGISFSFDALSGRLAQSGTTADLSSANLMLAWRIGEFGAGPALAVNYTSVAGISDTTTWAGAFGRHPVDRDLVVTWQALSNTRDFGRDYQVSAGAEFGVAPGVLLTGDLGYDRSPFERVTTGSAGIRYTITDRTDLTAEILHARGRSGGDKTRITAGAIGLNFRF